jgi:hypothetical protein
MGKDIPLKAPGFSSKFQISSISIFVEIEAADAYRNVTPECGCDSAPHSVCALSGTVFIPQMPCHSELLELLHSLHRDEPSGGVILYYSKSPICDDRIDTCTYIIRSVIDISMGKLNW